MSESADYTLDRAARLRTRGRELSDLLADDRCLLVPVWRNRNLVRAGGDVTTPVLLRRREGGELLPLALDTVFLGLLPGGPCFAIALPGHEETPAHPALADAGVFTDLRLAGLHLPLPGARLLAYARAVLYWHRHERHCGECGAETRAVDGGHSRVCTACQGRSFPRTDPAVMALVINGERCLCARQRSFPPGMYSILAGFVEPGEDLEEAVIREVREEVGLAVADVRYVRSQPWPFPRSLMIGFAMRARDDSLTIDTDELEDARWVGREQIGTLDAGFYVPPPFSLAGQLIAQFVAGEL